MRGCPSPAQHCDAPSPWSGPRKPDTLAPRPRCPRVRAPHLPRWSLCCLPKLTLHLFTVTETMMMMANMDSDFCSKCFTLLTQVSQHTMWAIYFSHFIGNKTNSEELHNSPTVTPRDRNLKPGNLVPEPTPRPWCFHEGEHLLGMEHALNTGVMAASRALSQTALLYVAPRVSSSPQLQPKSLFIQGSLTSTGKHNFPASCDKPNESLFSVWQRGTYSYDPQTWLEHFVSNISGREKG